MAMDASGQRTGWFRTLRTAADRYGRLRTALDGLRPSTDQKVGDSSLSGRASKALYGKGFAA